MSDLYRFLYLLVGALPYIVLFCYLLLSRKIKQFSGTVMLFGILGIVAAVALGAIAGLVVILNYPQTGSTVTGGFLNGVLAVMVGVALVVGELLRYMVVKKQISIGNNGVLTAIGYGVGFSLGEFAIFLFGAINNWNKSLSFQASVIILVDIIIEIAVSIAAFELISQDNFAFIAVGALYYLSFFFSYALHSSPFLNIAAKAIILVVSLALAFTFAPTKFQRGDIVK